MRKIVRFTVLLLLMGLMGSALQSCIWWLYTEDPIGDDGGERLHYELHICFVDAQTGSDLVKGIELATWIPEGSQREKAESGVVNTDCYDLEVILTNRSEVDSLNYRHPELRFKAFGDAADEQLYISFVLQANHCPLQEHLNYRLRCRHLFGDDEFHTLQIDWKEDKESNLYKARNFYCTGGKSNDSRIASVEAKDGVIIVRVR